MTDTMSDIRPPSANANQFAAATIGLDRPKNDMAPPEVSVPPVVSEQPTDSDFSAEKFDPTPTPVGDDGEASSSPSDSAEPTSAPEATVASDGSLEVNHDYDTPKTSEPAEDAEAKPDEPVPKEDDNTDKLRPYEDELSADGKVEASELAVPKSASDELYAINPEKFGKMTHDEFREILGDYQKLHDATNRAFDAEEDFLDKYRTNGDDKLGSA